jgi:hypothetical protein
MAGYTENGTYTNAKFMRKLFTDDPDDIDLKVSLNSCFRVFVYYTMDDIIAIVALLHYAG